jgi:soluble lytic murein transglycosylase-like protein
MTDTRNRHLQLRSFSAARACRRAVPKIAGRSRRGGFDRLVLFIVMILTLSSSAAWASIYVCREKSGAMNFTNAPTGSNCQPFSLTESISYQSPSRKAGDSTMYDLEIRRVGQRYQVDPPLIKAVIQAESDFDSRAVSSRGAQGLMQLMPETARELRVDNPFNPRENIDGGTRYLRQMLDNFNGDLTLSLAAYNAGPGLVSRTGGVPQIPETVQYVNKVLKQYKEYKRQPGNGIYLVRE